MKTESKFKYKYRYVSSSLSRHMISAVEKYLPKIGKPQNVRGIFAGGRNNSRPWYRVIISGENGKLVLRGCSWGYGGEGPHATRDVLLKLGVDQFIADKAAFRSDNEHPQAGSMKRCWVISLVDGSANISEKKAQVAA